MRSTDLILKAAILCAVMVLSACATSATRLKPDEVATDQGAFFGRVAVFIHGHDVTKKCYAEFTDVKEARKAYTSLDETGWVFTTVNTGDTYLSRVLCKLGGTFDPVLVEAKTRKIEFAVPGSGKIAYFGHVRLELKLAPKQFNPAVLLGGAIAGALTARPRDGGQNFEVSNQTDAATAEYQKRYGEKASKLTVLAEVPVMEQGRVPASE